MREQLRERLDVLTYEAPLAALRLVAVLEHATAEAGEAAAHAARADDQTWGEIATGLGLTE
ncbi:hypothetical protein [Streptomyces sp. NPDC055992]|uniref:hypothetical protein n=1 Tax=Streptomyces sp. NPDC055992 TaxID=3345673 RepID=UPI0035DF117A